MKKTRKILAMAACAILLVCISVGATVAYLTSTDSVTNTFTVGKVAITLDEAKVDDNGNGTLVADAARVKQNAYKLMPGHSYVKDPTVHFAAGSEASWLFVKVRNDIESIEDSQGENGLISRQITSNGWQELSNATDDDNTHVYYQKVASNIGNMAVDYKVFDGFKILNNANIAPFEPWTTGEDEERVTVESKIVITAYAIQADGFTTAREAWEAGNFQ